MIWAKGSTISTSKVRAMLAFETMNGGRDPRIVFCPVPEVGRDIDRGVGKRGSGGDGKQEKGNDPGGGMAEFI